MAKFLPFHALMPLPEKVAAVAAVPYDVVNSEEAAALAEGNALSFLRVSRPEIELAPGVDGLLSNGRLAALAKGRRIASAHEVVEEGQTLEVKIESIDLDAHKVALKPVTAEEPAKGDAPANDPDADPSAWIRANRAKNAGLGNNPFAGLNL